MAKNKSKSKENLNLTFNFKNCSYVCVHYCVQLLCTTEHRTVLIIFPLTIQTIIIVQMLSTGGNELLQERILVLNGSITHFLHITHHLMISFTVLLNILLCN